MTIASDRKRDLLKRIETLRVTAGITGVATLRLDATAAVLRGCRVQDAAKQARTTPRSVRRWLQTLERSGPESLLKSENRNGRPSSLDGVDRQALSADLRCEPSSFGYSTGGWSGSVLSRHLALKFKVRVSARHAQRLLKALTQKSASDPARDATIKAGQPADPGYEKASGRSPKWISDSRNKEVALRRIRRLSSSGLPLEPFVLSILELLNDAVPNADHKAVQVNLNDYSAAFICNSHEGYSQLSVFSQLTQVQHAETHPDGVRAPFTASGFHNYYSKKPVWRPDEWSLPSLNQTESFNVVFRSLGWDHSMIVWFSEGGPPFGYCPVWRGPDQRPFSHDDYKFFEACAPYIAHGLRFGQLTTDRTTESDAAFEFFPSLIWRTGVVLMDAAGGVIALDDEARSIFATMNVLDDVPASAVEQRFRKGLTHVHSLVMATFREDAPITSAPIVRLFSHRRTGISLKLRGSLARTAGGRALVTILVERGETRDVKRMRTMSRWGLSHREYQVVAGLGASESARQIATRLGLRTDTLKTYTKRIAEKVGIEGISELRCFARRETSQVHGEQDLSNSPAS